MQIGPLYVWSHNLILLNEKSHHFYRVFKSGPSELMTCTIKTAIRNIFQTLRHVFFLLGIYNIFYDNLHGNFSRHDSLSSKSHSSKHEKHSLGIYDTFLSDLCNNFIHLHMHARTRMYKLLSYPRAIPVRLRYTYLRIYKALSQLLFFPVVVPGLHQMTLGMFAVCSDDLVVFNRVADDNSWNVSYVFFENGSEL